jgi:hypothetical protein
VFFVVLIFCAQPTANPTHRTLSASQLPQSSHPSGNITTSHLSGPGFNPSQTALGHHDPRPANRERSGGRLNTSATGAASGHVGGALPPDGAEETGAGIDHSLFTNAMTTMPEDSSLSSPMNIDQARNLWNFDPASSFLRDSQSQNSSSRVL